VTAQAISVPCISTSAAANRAGLGLLSDTNYAFATAGKAGESGKRLNTRPITGAAGDIRLCYLNDALSTADRAGGEVRHNPKGVSARSLAKGTFYLNHLLLNGRPFVGCSASACHLGHLLIYVSLYCL